MFGRYHRLFVILGLSFAIIALGIFLVGKHSGVPVSKPGRYAGYSKSVYDEWVRTSQYVPVRDGTRLAVDVYRPSDHGKAVDKSFPVLWTHERYHRADMRNGQLITPVERLARLQKFIKYGYVIGIVDVRGGGASFGTRCGPFSEEETRDAYDITEWFAAQPWCDGKVGMIGRSYGGIAQYLAAAAGPPHLKAIFPEMAMFDLYSFAYPGGVLREDFGIKWSRHVHQLDTVQPAPPVDGDRDGKLLAAAMAEHRANTTVYELLSSLPYRDSIYEHTKEKLHLTRSPSTYIAEVKKSGVAVYHLAGWYDLWPKDALVWFANLDNPQKLIIGPWSHTDARGFSRFDEQLRWFDYWLKGIDNGIMNEAPIYYYTMGAPPGHQWRSARQWPPPGQKQTDYYFCGDRSGTVHSVNDGSLRTQLPVNPPARDDYTVDYSTTSGPATRWTNGYGGPFDYPDMTTNDQKGLTYTTESLAADLEVTGHPVVHVWITCTAKDVDLIAYLEEVDPAGFSHYITEGVLRASHRAISEPPFKYLGLPFHRSFTEDIAELPDQPVELVFDMHPTSNIFDSGHRIRVTLTCADRDNLLTPEVLPPPMLSVHRDSQHASCITLPVIPVKVEESQTRTIQQESLCWNQPGTLVVAVLALFSGLILCRIAHGKSSLKSRHALRL